MLGLGNAGERYEGTRHNVGQLTIDLLADRLGGAWTSHGDVATVLSTERNGHPVLLVKLAGMMNHSGSKFQRVAEALALPLRNCIVVHDDLDLPLGMVCAKHRGGDGGHRGIQSIIETFQDDRFRRGSKSGLESPRRPSRSEDYVLAAFPAEQLATLENALAMAADRVFDLIREEFGGTGILRTIVYVERVPNWVERTRASNHRSRVELRTEAAVGAKGAPHGTHTRIRADHH